MIDTKLLNMNQKEAVLSDEQYVRVIAGAGSGKTRVLTMRIAHLVEDEDVRPYKILAITFTNKAANEMKERISRMLQEGENVKWISTIHSLCVRILREDITSMGYPRNFTIIDSEDQKTICKEAIKQLNINDSSLTPAQAVNYISNNKSAEISVERAKVMAGDYGAEKDNARIYEYYCNRQKEMYALDFDDLIIWTVRMLGSFPDILDKWQRRFEYILVDEFQDIDNVQYRLIRYLTGKNNSLYVVGDPDQTIYTWRGANVDIIMHFQRDFPQAKTIILNENYRSTNAILNASNSVIKNNSNRMEKELFTQRKSDDKVVHYTAVDEDTQAAWIAGKIHELHAKGKAYSCFAILYRSNYLSRSLEKGLIDLRIPYVIYGGIRFYERMEVKDLLCYLRMITLQDDLALMRILNRPKRGIGSKTMDLIAQTARDNGISMYEVCKQDQIFSGKSKKTIEEFVSMVERWKKKNLDGSDLGELVESVIEESGLKAMLEADTEKGEERLENLKAVESDIKEYIQNYEDGGLDEYLQNIALYTDRDEERTQDCVQLMTVHSAKGLEFDTVFISDLNDGIFPSARAVSESKRGLEEERRLAYVAFTRAMNKLFLCEAGGYSYILQTVRRSSCFIREIDPQYLQEEGVKKREIQFSAMDFDDDFHDYQPRRTVQTARLPDKDTKSKKGYKKGDMVNHPKFGDGVIIREKAGILQIAFSYPYGVKSIASSFQGLTKKG